MVYATTFHLLLAKILLMIQLPMSASFTLNTLTTSIRSKNMFSNKVSNNPLVYQIINYKRKNIFSSRLMLSSSSIDSNNNDAMKAQSDGISRLSKLHKILSISGAPGSNACAEENDLIPFDNNESIEERKNLNPLLYPIAKSKSSGNYICSLRKISTNMATSDYDDSKSSSQQQLLPIVEAGLNSPGVKLLALNSEHLMRRIVCEADNLDKSYVKDVTDLYNEDLGSGETVSDKGLDVQYELGSVAKLG